MKVFLKILNYFFTTLGVIFFIIIMIGVYLFVADPFNLRPVISSFTAPSSITNDVGGSAAATSDKNPLLSPEQEKMLESVGIDPANLPTEVTPELENCLVDKVGAQRANEIANGADPTPVEILKASACLK